MYLHIYCFLYHFPPLTLNSVCVSTWTYKLTFRALAHKHTQPRSLAAASRVVVHSFLGQKARQGRATNIVQNCSACVRCTYAHVKDNSSITRPSGARRGENSQKDKKANLLKCTYMYRQKIPKSNSGNSILVREISLKGFNWAIHVFLSPKLRKTQELKNTKATKFIGHLKMSHCIFVLPAAEPTGLNGLGVH